MDILKQHDRSGTFENLKTPAIISSVLLLPFMILELVNRRNLNADFPVVLFVFMWLLALSFMAILMPILRSLPAGNRNALNPLSVLPRIFLSILIAWLWVGLVRDQMPCFLGVPNCD
jgi:nitric oxide reductase activation protein